MDNVKYKLVESKNLIMNKISKDKLYARIGMSFGIVLISSTMIMANIDRNNRNKKDEAIIEVIVNDNSIESLDISNNSQYIDDVDLLCSYLKIIDKYDRLEDKSEKYSIKDKLLNDYEKIKDVSLNLLKKKLSAEKKLNVEDIKIYVGRNGEYAEVGDDRIELNNDEKHYAILVANLQGYKTNELRKGEDVVFNSYMSDIKALALDSVKLIDDEKDYNISSVIGYIK